MARLLRKDTLLGLLPAFQSSRSTSSPRSVIESCAITAVTAFSQDSASALAVPSQGSRVTKFGVGVEIGIGVPLLAALGAVLLLLAREKRSNRELRQHAPKVGVGYDQRDAGNPPVAMHAQERVGELPMGAEFQESREDRERR
jgi:hypothetical protein